ncbi:tRNA-uridine aminocarboxypropyltransferase 1 [Toxorhynchites rutilus septentrionalis]|uniref:tRNA-uridine aminocarboxypropyltransferase 1 n=1 Tax=Toxorhynchites rutilus septentrionalis TaxID=329112 RepID=UPI002478388B|nr:tRNA-uridine aminocarboxypropyltransferase 1 [Toxorhynchites rutilus septentrionalis]
MEKAGETLPPPPVQNPFAGMKILDAEFLKDVPGRSACTVCGKSRKFFCYHCYVPVADLQDKIPFVQLPIQIDIIKHKNEIEGKSTAAHAAVLAPGKVKIYTYPDIPDYRQEDGVVLIFPTPSAMTVASLFSGEPLKVKDNYGLPKGHHMGTLLRCRLNDIVVESNSESKNRELLLRFPVRKAVFIDSTWSQCRGIYKDERVSCLRTVVIQNRISQFWRHQKNSPRWFLATVEAIHQFMIELHITAYGLDSRYEGLKHLGYLNLPQDKIVHLDGEEQTKSEPKPYNGQYDNLLFFFLHMYNLIHEYYEHHTLRAYRRPLFLEDKYQKQLQNNSPQ